MSDYPFTFKGRLVPGYSIPNDRRLIAAIQKEYNDEALRPVLLTIKLTHFKEEEECRWLSCSEIDGAEDEGYTAQSTVTNNFFYPNILGEYVMPCFLTSYGTPYSLLYKLEETPIDLSRDIEFYFLSVTADLDVKVLRNGTELRQNKGLGRRLHSLSPQAVQLDSFLYI